MSQIKAFALVAIGLAAAAVIWQWQQSEPRLDVSIAGERPASPHVRTPASDVTRSLAGTTKSIKNQDLPTAEVTASLSDRVNKLPASSDPQDAFSAYEILRQCQSARDEERQHQQTREAERDPKRAVFAEAGVVGSKAVARACGDLRPSDFRNRLALVERAAEAGVPMAALRFAEEGPWGDIQSLYVRSDDPLVQQWRTKAVRLIQLAASKGDVTSLNSLQAQYEDGAGLVAEKNLELALRYAVAKHLVHEMQTGRKILGADRELADLRDALAPDVAARARLDGERIAREAFEGRTR